MAPDSGITESGIAILPDEAWEHARHRAEIIGPMAELAEVGHQAADAATQTLGLSQRVELPRRCIRAGLWFRLLRTLLGELNNSTGLPANEGEIKPTNRWGEVTKTLDEAMAEAWYKPETARSL
jgi:TniQ.